MQHQTLTTGLPNASDPEPTLRLHRAKERGLEDFGWADNYLAFSFSGYRDPKWNNFGPLRVMIENHIQPRSGSRLILIVTPRSSHTSLPARSRIKTAWAQAAIQTGVMQHTSTGRGIVHSEENLHDVVEHNYQMWFIPDRSGTHSAYHQLRFTAEERQGRFRLYSSPDGREGSMPINTDVRTYAGLFHPGDTVQHVLQPGHGAWVQVVHGCVNVAGVTLHEGDGVGITGASLLHFVFEAETEALLFDLRMDTPLIWK